MNLPALAEESVKTVIAIAEGYGATKRIVYPEGAALERVLTSVKK